MLGISAPGINTPEAREKGINEIEGVYIGSVEEESGAYDANLQPGDIIKKIDDIKVQKFADLNGYISTKRPGDMVQVRIKRGEDDMLVPVTLKERQSLVVPVMNFAVKNLSSEDKKIFKVNKGVKIIGVPENYADKGLEGKIVIEVDGEPVTNIKDAKTSFEKISRYGKTVIILVNKDGERERVIFQ